ncbi:Myosin-13 [Manis pentadactyla]|nr:Myosin-13 [Manis pentadactyla]
MEARSKPDDIESSCWIKEEEEGFLAGEIQSEQGSQVTVKMVTNQWLPIYGACVANVYKGRKCTEMRPHLFSLLDNAYYHMLMDCEYQSMLITRECGAGKTENTKVIQYLASLGGTGKQSSDGKRLCCWSPTLGVPLSEPGHHQVENMDYGEERQIADVAFDVLGFSAEEKMGIYELTGGIMHFGNMKFKQKPREEQAEVDTPGGRKLQKGITRPQVKAGNVSGQKGQNTERRNNSIGPWSRPPVKRCSSGR